MRAKTGTTEAGRKAADKNKRDDKGGAVAGDKTKAPKPGRVTKVPFPRKNQPPSETEFVARLPLPVGKKFEGVRSYIKKQKDVAEDLYFYGPKTGWAYRYRRGGQSLATIMIHDDHLMGIVSIGAAALESVDFASLSEVGQRARKMAHGTPSLLWLDLPLDGGGAADFRMLIKAKLKSLPTALPPPPPPARRPGG